MGIIFRRAGKPFVFEAVSTVEFTPLSEWIARGVDSSYVVKRLTNSSSRLTEPAVGKLNKQAQSIRGKRYDPAFEWSDERFYCSELVWKIYKRALGIELGRLQRLRDFDLSDPIVSAKLRERYGDRVPLNERVISPAAIFDSPELTTIATK